MNTECGIAVVIRTYQRQSVAGKYWGIHTVVSNIKLLTAPTTHPLVASQSKNHNILNSWHCGGTVKPFNLAAPTILALYSKIILGPFIHQHVFYSDVLFSGIWYSTSAPLNFAISIDSWKSQNTGHADVKGLTVCYNKSMNLMCTVLCGQTKTLPTYKQRFKHNWSLTETSAKINDSVSSSSCTHNKTVGQPSRQQCTENYCA